MSVSFLDPHDLTRRIRVKTLTRSSVCDEHQLHAHQARLPVLLRLEGGVGVGGGCSASADTPLLAHFLPTDDRVPALRGATRDRTSALGPEARGATISCILSSHVSHVTLRVLPLTLATLRFARRASAAVPLAPLLPPSARRAVAARGHEHARLLGAADGGRGFGHVGEVGQLGGVVQQAARLSVVGVAVGVAVLLLDVPPELPALPRLQDFRLHLREEPRVIPSTAGCEGEDMTC